MKRKILIVFFAILLIALFVTCFNACKPTVSPAEIKDILKNVGVRIISSNRYTCAMQTTYNGNEEETLIKETRKPVYVEYSTTATFGNNLQTLIREENGKVVEYTNTRDNYYKKTLLGTPDSYEQPSYTHPDVNVWDDITLNTDNCTINYQNGSYKIVSNYKDVGLDKLKNMLEYVFDQTEKDALNNCVVTINITITQSKVVVSFKTTLAIGTDDKPNNKSLSITQTIDFSEFEQLNFDNGNYNVLHATSIEEVYGLTDISKPLICDAHDNVFMAELEQGLYCIKYESAPHVTICSADDINNVIELGILNEYISEPTNDYKYCFNIEKSGQYYIIFEYCENKTYEIVRCPYDDLYDIENPKLLQQNVTGIIEGKYDFEYYLYKAEKEGLLSIANTSNTAIDIICKVPAVAHYPYRTLTVPAGETLKNIPVINGGATLFVCKTDATQPVKYSLTTDFYQNDNGISTDFDEMPWITTEFSNDYYAVGHGLSRKLVRMHIDTKGLYTFEFENLYEDLSPNLLVSVYDANSAQSVDYKHYALEAGDYIVVLSNYYVDLSIAKVKYVLVKTAENFETTITLNKVSIAEKNSEKSRMYPLTDVRNQEVTYRFTLAEESVVLFDSYVCLFDANDTPLTFGYILNAIKLAAGEYYFMPNTFYPYYTVAIVEDYDGPVIDYGNMPVLTLDNPLVFATNDLKAGYFVIEIDHAGRYYFYDADVFVFDENLNGIARVPYSRYYDLTEGTYYACVYIESNYAAIKLTEVTQ